MASIDLHKLLTVVVARLFLLSYNQYTIRGCWFPRAKDTRLMEGPACLLAFCNLVLPLAPCPCACLKLWAPPLPGATDGVWLVCNKHLAVVKVSQSLVLVPDGVCGLRPGHVARPGRAGSMQSFCRIPVFTRLHQAMPLIPPQNSPCSVSYAECQLSGSCFGGWVGGGPSS